MLLLLLLLLLSFTISYDRLTDAMLPYHSDPPQQPPYNQNPFPFLFLLKFLIQGLFYPHIHTYTHIYTHSCLFGTYTYIRSHTLFHPYFNVHTPHTAYPFHFFLLFLFFISVDYLPKKLPTHAVLILPSATCRLLSDSSCSSTSYHSTSPI